MKHLFLLLIVCCMFSCKEKSINPGNNNEHFTSDSIKISGMVSEREKAMTNKDIDAAMSQFSDDATWINSQGYYFEGKDEVLKFHGMLAGNDTLDYYYEAGQPRIRLLDDNNAVAYYSWKMYWYKKKSPDDTTFREIGLMTLSAQKKNDIWKWVAVTNQHTPWFYDKIEAVKIE